MTEVIKYATDPVRIRIERGALAGWIVYLDDGRPGSMGETAAFSNSAEMLDWLRKSIRSEE